MLINRLVSDRVQGEGPGHPQALCTMVQGRRRDLRLRADRNEGGGRGRRGSLKGIEVE